MAQWPRRPPWANNRADNLPSASVRATCDVCNVEYTLRGMATHKRGLRCKVDAVVWKYAQQGLAPLASPDDQQVSEYRSWMVAAKIPFESAWATYVAGDQNRDSLAKNGVYIQMELVAIVRELKDGVPSLLPFKLKMTLLGMCQDPEFRRAFTVLNQQMTAEVQAARDSIEINDIPSLAEQRAMDAYGDLMMEWNGAR